MSFRLPNDPAYEAQASYEAALHTERSRNLYAKNERRLVRARARHDRAEAKAKRASERKLSKRQVAELWSIVEKRRDELAEIEREMRFTPAGSQHRGRGSHRGIPTT